MDPPPNSLRTKADITSWNDCSKADQGKKRTTHSLGKIEMGFSAQLALLFLGFKHVPLCHGAQHTELSPTGHSYSTGWHDLAVRQYHRNPARREISLPQAGRDVAAQRPSPAWHGWQDSAAGVGEFIPPSHRWRMQ